MADIVLDADDILLLPAGFGPDLHDPDRDPASICETASAAGQEVD